MKHKKKGEWALILGGSSGLGLATAKKLALHGYDLLVVHRDRKSDLEAIYGEFEAIRSHGVRLHSFNTDVANVAKTKATVQEIRSLPGTAGNIKVLVHSIAKGCLKPMHSSEGATLGMADFEITLKAMALSLYDWTKALVGEGLFCDDGRVISYTSEGNSRAWPGYAAVSAAKVSLEAITRNMSLEFAPLGIKANCIQAGTTETKAFAAIPGHEVLRESALRRNPNGRLTLPEDVADAAYLLTTDEARWITGTVLKVDGGRVCNNRGRINKGYMPLNAILKKLPYEDPFLFVDTLLSVDEDGAEGTYRFPVDAWFYKGHFKGKPVTPGVILTECCAQIGVVCTGIFLMGDEVPNDENEIPIALSSSEMEFFLPVYPGETVRVRSKKRYFRFQKLKCEVKMYNAKEELVCRGNIAGMIKPLLDV